MHLHTVCLCELLLVYNHSNQLIMTFKLELSLLLWTSEMIGSSLEFGAEHKSVSLYLLIN